MRVFEDAQGFLTAGATAQAIYGVCQAIEV
jgi:hypothetical protein